MKGLRENILNCNDILENIDAAIVEIEYQLGVIDYTDRYSCENRIDEIAVILDSIKKQLKG